MYITVEIRGVNLKGELQLKSKEWNYKKARKNPGKDSKTYQKRNKIIEFKKNQVRKTYLMKKEKRKFKKIN